MAARFGRKALVLILVLAVLLSLSAHNLLWKSNVPSVSAVLIGGDIGVYWDAKCTKTVTSIDWGNLTPGATEEVAVYVRNEGNQTVALNLTPQNWNPANASQYLTFSWNYRNSVIEAGSALTVSQTLNVTSPYPDGFSHVTFDVLFESLDHLPADVNRDGIVNMKDMAIVAAAFGSKPGDSNWNPNADINNDGVVNMKDMAIVAGSFGLAF